MYDTRTLRELRQIIGGSQQQYQQPLQLQQNPQPSQYQQNQHYSQYQGYQHTSQYLPHLQTPQTTSNSLGVQQSQQFVTAAQREKRENNELKARALQRPCVSCGLSGDKRYLLSHCQGPTHSDGFLWLCPLCFTNGTHLLETCPKFTAVADRIQQLKKIMRYAVLYRAGIAPLILAQTSVEETLDELKKLNAPWTVVAWPLTPAQALRNSNDRLWVGFAYETSPALQAIIDQSNENRAWRQERKKVHKQPQGMQTQQSPRQQTSQQFETEVAPRSQPQFLRRQTMSGGFSAADAPARQEVQYGANSANISSATYPAIAQRGQQMSPSSVVAEAGRNRVSGAGQPSFRNSSLMAGSQDRRSASRHPRGGVQHRGQTRRRKSGGDGDVGGGSGGCGVDV